jgi:pSer/pThr/pTyr-binding forkhead associated (FHA) protein
MRLRYTKHDGTRMEFQLGDQPITIGRSPDADIVLLDEKVSRIHCGIRLWDGDFYIKDLKSKNGTWVNGDRAEVAKLRPSDSIRVGSTTFTFEQDLEVGPGHRHPGNRRRDGSGQGLHHHPARDRA